MKTKMIFSLILLTAIVSINAGRSGGGGGSRGGGGGYSGGGSRGGGGYSSGGGYKSSSSSSKSSYSSSSSGYSSSSSYSSAKPSSSSSTPSSSSSAFGSSKNASTSKPNASAEKPAASQQKSTPPHKEAPKEKAETAQSSSWLPAFMMGGIMGGLFGTMHHHESPRSPSNEAQQTPTTAPADAQTMTITAQEITPAMIARCLQIQEGSYTFAAEENVEKETHDCAPLIAQYQQQVEQNKQAADQNKSTDQVIVH